MAYAMSLLMSALLRLFGVRAFTLTAAQRRFAAVNGLFFCACMLMGGFALALVSGEPESGLVDMAQEDQNPPAHPAPAYKGLILTSTAQEDIPNQTAGATYER